MLVKTMDQHLRELGGRLVEGWSHALARGRNLSDQGYLFHGTSLDSAHAILAGGFESGDSSWALHVYWGRLDYAENFASRWYRGLPAILAAPLDAVLASGIPLPMTSSDRQMEDASELATWQESHAESGCLRIRDGRHVEGLILLSPMEFESA